MVSRLCLSARKRELKMKQKEEERKRKDEEKAKKVLNFSVFFFFIVQRIQALKCLRFGNEMLQLTEQ